jgi:hypothetical protein
VHRSIYPTLTASPRGLRAHREKIESGLNSGEDTWPILCTEYSSHGVVSRDGEPPSKKAAWKASQTLCRELETLGETPMEKTRRPKPRLTCEVARDLFGVLVVT